MKKEKGEFDLMKLNERDRTFKITKNSRGFFHKKVPLFFQKIGIEKRGGKCT